MPCIVQGQENRQAEPAISGTGNTGHTAICKNSTTLGSSTIFATGGNVGIGTTTQPRNRESTEMPRWMGISA
jgi:hypothetical protein